MKSSETVALHHFHISSELDNTSENQNAFSSSRIED